MCLLSGGEALYLGINFVTVGICFCGARTTFNILVCMLEMLKANAFSFASGRVM